MPFFFINVIQRPKHLNKLELTCMPPTNHGFELGAPSSRDNSPAIFSQATLASPFTRKFILETTPFASVDLPAFTNPSTKPLTASNDGAAFIAKQLLQTHSASSSLSFSTKLLNSTTYVCECTDTLKSLLPSRLF